MLIALQQTALFMKTKVFFSQHITSLCRVWGIVCVFCFSFASDSDWAWGQAMPKFHEAACYTQAVPQVSVLPPGQPNLSWDCLNYVKVYITFIGANNYTQTGNAYPDVLGNSYSGLNYAEDIIQRMNELLAHNMPQNVCNGWLYYTSEANVTYGTVHRDAPTGWEGMPAPAPDPGFRFVLANPVLRFAANTSAPPMPGGLNLYINPGINGGNTGAYIPSGGFSILNDQANIHGCSIAAAGVGLHELLHNMSLDHNFCRPFPRYNDVTAPTWDPDLESCLFFDENYDKCSFDWNDVDILGYGNNNIDPVGCNPLWKLVDVFDNPVHADPDGINDTPFCWDCNFLWTDPSTIPHNTFMGCNDPEEIDNNAMNYVYNLSYGHALTQGQINQVRSFLNGHQSWISNTLPGTEQRIDVYINSGTAPFYGIEPFKTWDCADDIDFLCVVAGTTVTLTAASTSILNPLSYAWSTGATTQSITVAPTVTTPYTVTITNASGCTGTDAIIVKSPPAEVTLNPTNIEFCANFYNGVYVPGMSYHIDTNTPPNSVSSNITEYTWLVNGNLAGQAAVDCPTCFTNGTDPHPTAFDYWTSPFIDIPPSQSGLYTVIVTANNGCTASATVNVVGHINPVPEVVIENIPSAGFVACFEETVNMGVQPNSTIQGQSEYASYLWENGVTTDNLSLTGADGIAAGHIFMVTVTDVHGCTGTDGASVTFLLPLSPVITGNTNICPTGSTTLTADDTNVYNFSPGEVAAFEYQWSNGATTQSITVNTTGTYTVTITRLHDGYPTQNINYPCSATTSITVTANPPTTPILLPIPSPICQTDAPINLTQYVSNYANVTGGDFIVIGTNGIPQTIEDISAIFNPALFAPDTYTIQYTYQPPGCDVATSQIQTLVVQDCSPLGCIALQTYLSFSGSPNYTALADADAAFTTWTPASNPFGAGLGLSSNPVKINGTITIPDNSEIRIDGMHFVFGPNGRIDVRRRGQLTLKRSIFEGDPTCNTMWQGFRVWGPGVNNTVANNEGGEQQDAGGGIHTGMLLFDGDPVTTTNVIVRDAIIGVATTRLDNYNLATVASSLTSFNAGGIPYALTPSAVSVLPQLVGAGSTQAEGHGGGWLHIRKASGARFENCFYGTLYTQYQGGSYIQPAALAADGINGYKIDGAVFTTDGNLRYPFTAQSTEIGVAGLHVLKTRLSIANSTFENLHYGIRANDLRQLNVRSLNQFNNCLRGISTQVTNLGATQFTRIEGNTFNSCLLSIQGDALQTLITGNNIYGPLGQTEMSVGIFMRDSDYSIGGDYGAVGSNFAGNFISDVNVGIAVIGGTEDPTAVISPEIKNNTISRTNVAIHTINNNEDLDIACNQLLNYNYRGINIRSWNGTQGNLKDQGDCGAGANIPAFNTFFPLGALPKDLFADATSLDFKYADIGALGLTVNDPVLITTEGCLPTTATCNTYQPAALSQLIDNSTPAKTKYKILSEWLRQYQADSNYVAAAALLEQNTALPVATLKLIQQYYDTENYTAADALLESIDRSRLETNQFYTLQKMLIQLKQEGKTYANINTQQEATLLNIANSHTSVGYRAQAILYQARGYEFPVIIPPLNDGDVYGYTVFKQNMTANTNVPFGKFVPNPTNGITTLSYNLTDKQTAILSIFDLNGRKVTNATLQGSGNYLFDTTTNGTGLYMYTITVNGKVIQRDKLIVVK